MLTETGAIVLGREDCANLDAALAREWLVTNGLGGFASGTVAGANTRQHHGLLVAATAPPEGRRLLVAKLDEIVVDSQGVTYLTGLNEYNGGYIHPQGLNHLEAFSVDGNTVIYRYRVGSSAFEKRIWMEQGRNTTYVLYRLVDGPALNVQVEPLITDRDYQSSTRGDLGWRFLETRLAEGVELRAHAGAIPIVLLAPGATWTAQPDWFWHFFHRIDHQRGLPDTEDLYQPGFFAFRLAPDRAQVIALTSEPSESVGLEAAGALERRRARDEAAIAAGDPADAFERRMLIAADQFVVQRGDGSAAIIAGYPWFTDWGRDTCISLRGLALAAGHPELVAPTVRRLLSRRSNGLVPNRFSEEGLPAEFNSADAGLWLFQLTHDYTEQTGDLSLVQETLPALKEILDAYLAGTDFGIGVDPEDGLLRASAEGYQLTWMDAKVGDWVVTPRRGKPVEINALWYNALSCVVRWLPAGDESRARYEGVATAARDSFNRRYWHDTGKHLYDVIDGPEGDDPALRPNQLLAISLAYPILAQPFWEAVLGTVERELVTPFGLRTLARWERGYAALYRGDRFERDAAYHQGTIWPWLIGPYVDACLRVRGDRRAARAALAEFPLILQRSGLGSIDEVFSAEPPHEPGGCPQQAWSVAEVLRCWRLTRPAT